MLGLTDGLAGLPLTRSGVVGSRCPHDEVTVVGVSGTRGIIGMARKLLIDLRTLDEATCLSSRVVLSSVTSLGSSKLNRPMQDVNCSSSFSRPSLLLRSRRL